MEGFSYLFKIPSVSTRNRVLSQRLWQIDGQTMFVAKWEPGLVPKKPELEAVPIWLELRNVPLQFFHEDGLEYIAGMVGDPKVLHQMTANKTNLEVAKVLTVIDPRQPLPEAVNVQFESGEISRIAVSCPWMPPVCSGCKEIGHPLQKCKQAPVTCKVCNSRIHVAEKCPKKKLGGTKEKVTIPGISILSPVLGRFSMPVKKQSVTPRVPSNDPSTSGLHPLEKEAEVPGSGIQKADPLPHSLTSSSSDAEEDSSDVSSHDTASDIEPEVEFTQVQTRRQRLIQQGLQLRRPLTIGKRR